MTHCEAEFVHFVWFSSARVHVNCGGLSCYVYHCHHQHRLHYNFCYHNCLKLAEVRCRKEGMSYSSTIVLLVERRRLRGHLREVFRWYKGYSNGDVGKILSISNLNRTRNNGFMLEEIGSQTEWQMSGTDSAISRLLVASLREL